MLSNRATKTRLTQAHPDWTFRFLPYPQRSPDLPALNDATVGTSKLAGCGGVLELRFLVQQLMLQSHKDLGQFA